MPPGNILTSLQAHTLARKAVSSQQMASPGCQVCSTLSAVWGTRFFGPCSSPPLPLPRVADGATRDVGQGGRGEGRGGLGTRSSGAWRSPRVLRPPPFPSEPCHLAARAASAPPHLPSLRSSAFLPPPPSSSLSLILTFRLASLCPLPGGFPSQAGAPAPACPPPHHLQL